MKLEELETPFPVVDLEIAERNLSQMQAYCDAHGLALRPHIKTHKNVRWAKRQLELGAKGITCQKLGEAEVMAAAGIEDIFISYPIIGDSKIKRLAKLSESAKIGVAADSQEAISSAQAAGRLSGQNIGLLIEFDSGAGRTGVRSVEEALSLARFALESPRVRFDGLMTYPTGPATGPFIEAALEAFSNAGIEIRVISGGGTPLAFDTHTVPGITELRVGNYIFNDRSEITVNPHKLPDCAMHVYATVVSRPEPNRAILDSGSKTLSSDLQKTGGGYGLIREYPAADVVRLYEEHALVDLSACDAKPAIGDRVRVLPNHSCVVTNLHDEVAVLQDGGVEFWKVDARGKTR